MRDLSRLGTTKELQLKDGRRLRYLQAGSGKPLLLLHTIRTQLDYFQAVIPQLAQHYTVYALDLPGHGYASIDTQAQYDEPYMRSGVIGFIEQLDLTDLTIAGESIGAVLALTVSRHLPQRVARVIASNTYDYDTRYADGVRRGNFLANFVLFNFSIPINGAIFAALENRFLLGWILRGGLGKRRSMPEELVREFDRVGRRRGYRYVERNLLKNWRSWGQARSLYPKQNTQVTLVYGEKDWSTVEERRRTADTLGLNGHITLKDTGHFAFVDNPEALVEIILDRQAT
ncbi:MAG TPA: alpha/beta hydrolase [Methylophilaceae bacterium]|nr:alpha/beta hydrolase [Methylophilaceae bacterium]